MDATVVCIDQTEKAVQAERRTAWFPRCTRPAVEVPGQRDWTCLPGPITENGDRIFDRFEAYVTADHTKHLNLILWKGVEYVLIVVRDGALCFQASAVTDLVARDDHAFVRLPPYSSGSSSVGECWRQPQQTLGNWCYDSLDELTTAIDTALDQLSVPKVGNYF
jgi:hypothetical protein